MRIFHVWIADGVEIEGIVRWILHIPEEFLVSGGERMPGCYSCTIVPDDFLDEKKSRPVPEEIRQWNRFCFSRDLDISDVQPEGSCRLCDSMKVIHPFSTPSQVFLDRQRGFIFFPDVVRGACDSE